MPDMDGFKLLELVGLEMDLPVIIRIEELKNIWQHVVRSRFDKNRGGDKKDEGGDGRANRKRKDQYNEDEDEERDDDPSSQKKPRVVWTVELHKKFVAAVNQLGYEKAMPKKILDLMNVEKLTRENVASHLQKFRLYLKRISGNQQAIMANSDLHFLQMSNGLVGFHHQPVTVGTSQLRGGAATVSMRPFPPNGHHVALLPLNHCDGGNILQGLPLPLAFDQLHTNTMRNMNNNNKSIAGNSMTFPSFLTQHSSVPNNNQLVLEGHPQAFPGHHQINKRLEHWSNAVSSSSSLHQLPLPHSKPDSLEWNTHNVSSSYSNSTTPLSPALDTNPPAFYITTDFDSDFNANVQAEVFYESMQMRQSGNYGPTADAMLSSSKPKEGFIVGQQKLQSGFMGAEAGSLDDIVNSTMKQEQSQGDLSGGELGYGGISSLRTCI